jgi:sec-independent protein translocase protein TatA
MFGLGVPEMVVLMVLGLLLFGNKLPSMARSVGKGIVEFKKGINGLEDEVNPSAALRQEPAPREPLRAPQRVAATAPKFEEPANNLPAPSQA